MNQTTTASHSNPSNFDSLIDIISLIVGVDIRDNRYPIPVKMSELRKYRFFVEALETSSAADIVAKETPLVIDQKSHILFHGAYNDSGWIGSWSFVAEVM